MKGFNFASEEALARHLAETNPEVEFVGWDVGREGGESTGKLLTKAKGKKVTKAEPVYTEWEREYARAHTGDDWLWFTVRSFTAKRDTHREKCVACRTDGRIEVTGRPTGQPPILTEWTKPEEAFYYTYMFPWLESRTFEIVIDQVPIYMPGQRYTADFVGITADGNVHYFEVKGERKLKSEERASNKVRWLAFYVSTLSLKHEVYWAKKTKGGDFRITEKRPTRRKHPAAK